MKKAAIIVAGGKGLRMGTDIPKQFLPINGVPILMHTIKRFYDYDPSLFLVVVLPSDQHEYWHKLCDEHHFSIPHIISTGGSERFYSVKNGLSLIPDDIDLIAVHDGVRPFVSTDVIEHCFNTAATHGAAIPVIDIIETLRHVTPNSNHTVPRNEYKIVQTPQIFSASLLRNAYQQSFSPSFTDDASVVESLGHSITLTPGNRENIKITTPSDL